MAVPNVVPLILTVTVLSASAVPAITSVESVVMPSLSDAPESVVMPVTTGALGAVRSNVTASEDESPLSWPPTS